MNCRPHHRIPVLLAALALGGADAAAAAPGVDAAALTPETARPHIEKALADYERAVDLARQSPEASRELFQQAASGFDSVSAAGFTNTAIEYNAANAWFRLDRLGKAIAGYRRALHYSPRHARVRANLDYARNRVEPRVAPTQSSALLRNVAFLHYWTSQAERLGIALAAGVLGWGCLIARLRWPRPLLLALGGAGAFVSLTCCLSIWLEQRDLTQRPPAVVVEQATLRLGRGENYEAALSQPLGPGVELRIRESRAGWVDVELPDGRTGWLPESAIELVLPAT